MPPKGGYLWFYVETKLFWENQRAIQGLKMKQQKSHIRFLNNFRISSSWLAKDNCFDMFQFSSSPAPAVPVRPSTATIVRPTSRFQRPSRQPYASAHRYPSSNKNNLQPVSFVNRFIEGEPKKPLFTSTVSGLTLRFGIGGLFDFASASKACRFMISVPLVKRYAPMV